MHQMRPILSLLLLVVMTTLSNFPVQAQACDGFTTQLGLFKNGKVVTPEINVRKEPNGDILLKMKSGDIFLVIGGARCDGNLTWWQVRIGETIGWSAEANNTGRLLAPVSSRRQSNSAINGQSNGFGGDSIIRSACDNGVALTDSVQAFTYSEATPWTAQADGTTINLTTDDLRGTTSLGYIVEACTTAPIFTAEATYLETGVTFDAVVESLDFATSIRMPPIAYTLPGTWNLLINNFSINLVVPTLTAPI
jgi:hypothetical protein